MDNNVRGVLLLELLIFINAKVFEKCMRKLTILGKLNQKLIILFLQVVPIILFLQSQ